MVKTGLGFDVHRFQEGRPCILAGVDIPSTQGLVGHSDADVATHAIIDAILGAAALGDIGQWFPDHDPTYLNIRSITLLEKVIAVLHERGWQLEHIDVTIAAELPKIAPYYGAMRACIAEAIAVGIDAVSIKATTTEKLGFIGRGEGIAAMAVATIGPVNFVEKSQKKLDVRQLSPQNMAYIGDAVYELHIRRHLLEKGITRGYALQKAALSYVSATAQAQMAQAIKDGLSVEEQRILKWGRNASSGSIPKNTVAIDYRYSTGIEALIGYLHLNGQGERLAEILDLMIKAREE